MINLKNITCEMTTYIVFNTVILLFIIFSICYVYYLHRETRDPAKRNEGIRNNSENQTNPLNWKLRFLLLTVLILIIGSFFVPFILTRKAINEDFNFSQTGQIGDTIGGLMNPFIAIAGVIVTGLAFYVQIIANQQQRELFLQEQAENKLQLQKQIDNQNQQNKIQQFESQFYEMLRLHRENITEMKIEGYNFTEKSFLKKYDKVTEGRKLFIVMKTELECILSVYKKDRVLDKEGFKKCYSLFFLGLNAFERTYPQEKKFVEFLKNARRKHESPSRDIKTNKKRKELLPNIYLYFNYKPFSGHLSRLGHYYRHLYLVVKSVANSDVILDYEERMKYLRILRAQLSNHEQIFLFYNWLSGYGNDWENDNHQFFTEFCMIHNLLYDDLFEDNYISNTVNYLRTMEVKFRKGKMFEID